jgi:hypothetical protein
LSTRKHGLNLLVGFSSSKQGQLFFYFSSPLWQCQSALLSSASEVKVGWRAAAAAAAAAAGSWAGNNPPVIEIYILKHFLNSWLHNRFLHFQV